VSGVLSTGQFMTACLLGWSALPWVIYLSLTAVVDLVDRCR
jgi:hypothetical protein